MEEKEIKDIKEGNKCCFHGCNLNKNTIIWILTGALIVVSGIAISLALCENGNGFRKFDRDGMRMQMNERHGEGMRGNQDGSGFGRKIQEENNMPNQAPTQAEEVAPSAPQAAPVVN